MRHYILVNHHHIDLPGLRDLIKALKNDKNFVVSHWKTSLFVDPRNSKYKSFSLLGNFQKLDNRSNPLRVPDYDLLNFWTELGSPRIWISSMIDLHLGIDEMLFGKNTLPQLNAKQTVVDSFDGLGWAYEQNLNISENYSYVNDSWAESSHLAGMTRDFLIKSFKNRLDFPWAIKFPVPLPNLKKKYDFCIPGARYTTRLAIEKKLSENFNLAPYQKSDEMVRKLVSVGSKLIPPLRPIERSVKTKIREINMNHLISLSKFTYVDGGPLGYFVRKYLEVSAAGSILVCSPSQILSTYGFVKNKHFIDVNVFLQNIEEETEVYKMNNSKVHQISTLIKENHSFVARITQLLSFLDIVSARGTGLGFFSDGTFTLQQ